MPNLGIMITSLVLGILIKFFKAHFLIAGYNIMSAEEKKRVDIDGLASLLGYGLIAGGVLLFLGGVIHRYGILYASAISLVLYFIGLVLLLIKAQSYVRSK